MAGFRKYGRPLLVPLAVTGIQLLGALFVHPTSDHIPAVGYACMAVGGLVLLVHRRLPLTVLWVTAVSVLVAKLAGYELMPLAFIFAVYYAVRRGYRWMPLIAASVLMGGLRVLYILLPDVLTPPELVRALGWIVAAGVAGEAQRQAEQRVREVVRTQEETARRRAGEERLSIARELHDSLTHQISIIKVQAGVAIHLARKRGEEISAALLAIRDASDAANRELRATLETLRSDETGRHGLERLPDLIVGARSAGLTTTMQVAGERQELPSDVDMTAYRIIQESLTNVAKHAGPTVARVNVNYGADVLTVQIDDDGQVTYDAAPTPGIGLIGMRERVSALGGTLSAEPRPEGGFTVRAELPVAK